MMLTYAYRVLDQNGVNIHTHAYLEHDKAPADIKRAAEDDSGCLAVYNWAVGTAIRLTETRDPRHSGVLEISGILPGGDETEGSAVIGEFRRQPDDGVSVESLVGWRSSDWNQAVSLLREEAEMMENADADGY